MPRTRRRPRSPGYTTRAFPGSLVSCVEVISIRCPARRTKAPAIVRASSGVGSRRHCRKILGHGELRCGGRGGGHLRPAAAATTSGARSAFAPPWLTPM